MKPLTNLPQEIISSGLHPSLPPNDAPLWTDGRNVIFRDGGVRPEPAQSIYFIREDKSPIRGMLEVRQDTVKQLYYGTCSKLYKFSPGTGAVTVLGTGYTGLLAESASMTAHRWALEAWGDWVVAASAHQQILVDKFDGMGFVPLAGTPVQAFKPELLVKWGPHMLAFNHTDGQAGHITVWWCKDDDLEVWTPAADNSAGSMPIHDAPSPFRAALRFGQGIVALTDSTLHAIGYIQDPYYFGVGGRLQGIGAVSKHSVIDTGGVLYGFGPRGIWQSDAVTYDYIDHPSVRDFIFDDINRKQLSQIHAWHDVQNQRVVWWWCGRDSMVLNRALGYHYKSGNWHVPDYVREASSQQSVFDYPLVGDSDGNIYIVGVPGGVAPAPYAPITLEPYAHISGSFSGYGKGGYGYGFYGGKGIVGG